MKPDEYIQNIKIKKYKCLDDFEAKGFKRINLIAGKNNVGKTVILEALLISCLPNLESLYHCFISIKTNRDTINVITSLDNPIGDLQSLINQDEFNITTNLGNSFLKDAQVGYDIKCLNNNYHNKTYAELEDFIQKKIKIRKYAFITNFISSHTSVAKMQQVLIDSIKLNGKYEELNSYFKILFEIDNIDIIDNKPHIKINNKYEPMSFYGEGIKYCLNIILALMSGAKKVFIDEIENGIHHDTLNKLWEIILEISEKYSIQVFITTHSKECIESYSMSCKKLNDTDISFVELGMNKDRRSVMVYSYDWLLEKLEDGNDLRGW